MTLESVKISPSVQLSAIRTDRFKTGVLTFTLVTPLSPESTALHILLSGIMRRGTKRYPSLSLINRRLDELYATEIEIRSSKLGKNILFTLTAELLDNRYALDSTDILAEVIDTAAEILLCPLSSDHAFDAATVEQEKRCALDSLNAEINNTRAYSITRCTELMYRERAQYPTVKRIKEILADTDATRLYAHYQNLLKTARLDVFYVGSTPTETVAKHVSAAFSGYPCGEKAGMLPISAASPSPMLFETEKMPVSQGKLALGFRTGVCASETKRYHPALVLNEIFGGSAASKLFLNVREKMSLCYFCSSSYSIYTGDLMVSSGIEVGNLSVAYDAILRQMDDIKNGLISDTEFSAAQKSLENCYRQIYDNPLEMQGFFGTRAFFGIEESIEECRERLASVTKQEVVDFAEKTVHDTAFFVEGTKTANDGEEVLEDDE